MDLPSCPSCRQSVLDDDADVCPFCGAPMKGGAVAQPSRGAARPAAAAPRPSTRPEPKGTASVSSKASSPAGTSPLPSKATKSNTAPAQAGRGEAIPSKSSPSKPPAGRATFDQPLEAKSPSRPPAAAQPPFDLNEDPLDVRPSGASDAIPAARQRTKSKPHKITCPMCETVGYVPQSAAGKEVRCANPNCLVPVFVAPRIQRKAVEAPPPAKSGLPLILVGLLALLVVLGGAGAWYVFNQPSPGNQPNPVVPPTPVTPPVVTKVDPKDPNAVEPPVNPQVVDKLPTLADEREPVLALMAQDAREKERNLRPPYCQRVTAQTAADCGDLVTAKTFLDLLSQNKHELNFYRVGPLTSVAWQQLKQADKSAAGKTLDDALAAAADLPTVGRYSIDSAVWLAAALVAGGRDREALALVTRFPATGSTGRLVASMSTAAAWNTWDTVAAQRERPLLDVASLQCPIVVEIAVSQGFPAEALRFAESLSHPAERNECQIVWGEAVARARGQAKPAAPIAIDPILAKLKPVSRARLQARLSSAQLRANDRAGAEKLLASAIASLGNVAVKPEFVIPSMKNLASLEFPDPAPARLDALALAEIARLEGALHKRDEARNHLSQAIGVLRAAVPNLNAARMKVEEAARLKAADLEKPIPASERKAARAALKRHNSEQARVALEKVQQTSKVLLAAAEARFAVQTEIFETALAWDDAAHLWKEIGPSATAMDPDQKEPYFDTALPWQLAVDLRRAGDKAEASKINEAAGVHVPPAAAVLDLLAEKVAESDVDVNSLAKKMQSFSGAERADRERATLAGSSYLLHAGKVGDAFQFVRMFDDPQLKEEALQWTAALACRLNFTRQTKEILHAASFIPTQSVSAYRGFLLGLLAREIASDVAPPADAAGKPPAAEAKHAL
ncbi:MAG TPA: hypothetical protein VMR25_15095 [Planctomycetaceae bacterium]|jgi:hypothetical protein|nr:hypothetical protein [Planctomycetaceae bacterium]